MTARLDYRTLEALLAAFPDRAREARRNAYQRMRRTVAPRVLTKAADKTPFLWGDLRRSGRVETGADDVAILFGGFAVQYAERQHEETSYHHPGRYGKYVYRGKVAPHEGELNDPRTVSRLGLRRGVVGLTKSGRRKWGWFIYNAAGRSEVYAGRVGKRWRRHNVTYARRQLAVTRRPSRPGQARFLFGAPNSAWEENADWAEEQLYEALLEPFERLDIAA